MIRNIGIKDFQSIDSLQLECGPITVLVGESDSGKSAVVRALYALAFNDYPTDHVRQGAEASRVAVSVDGRVVGADKGKGRNGYFVVDGGDEKRWDRVGRDVPGEVADLLGWRIVELDDGTRFTPSIHRQFDGPFLLADSKLRVAKVLGSLTNIATLFSAIREGTRAEREARKASDVAREEARRHEADAEAVEAQAAVVRQRADAAHAAWEEARSVVEALERVEAVAGLLRRRSEAVAGARAALEGAEAALFDLPDLDPVFAEALRLEGVATELRTTAASVESWRKEAEEAAHRLSDAEAALSRFEDGLEVCPLCERVMA